MEKEKKHITLKHLKLLHISISIEKIIKDIYIRNQRDEIWQYVY